ncbi:L-threonylcarbamoyladenylate synthase [Microcella frigidaquae]|uniref:L-threonylcarbamoyladenylate synthase n=1 Tax=Microcella frigidaquae TaxID=424758 RepID=A0A840X8Y3_9MICO|nr:L-threonylcarbamoyladenylate synthase [Microcella frigidaquae]MBB5618830.1 tRNA threonylcarbamoyl adenosine modification protein (Sua5/YciO/YrdC/YwlC family) [Microcella frigidaquae]NHN44931.1 threonylcarbamoyl-AMP synthase [Microcella frigidaquae]
MTAVYDCSVESELLEGLRAARGAIGRGELVVIPTDTVYGLAADAFRPAAVERLLTAKEASREAPPAVLIPGIPTLNALAESVPAPIEALVAEFWPGALTVVVEARESLAWDLGESRGTVALRMPDNRHARHLLADTGPLAVTSANISGMPAATTAQEALAMLGDRVSVVLDGGALEGDAAERVSTIVDATSLHLPEGTLRILRQGAIPEAEILRVAGADRAA